MRTGFIKKAAMWLFLFIVSYLLVGHLFHRVIFPEQKPVITGHFKPGQVLYSKTEGFRQTVIKHEKRHVHCTLEMEPYAAGPPKHIHADFDETFQIENGELTVWVDGKIKKLRPGEVLHIPKGIPHKPYNETADAIRLKGSFAFPEKFAFNLVQVYGIMDSRAGFEQSPDIVLQMVMFQDSGFDSYLAEGPPVFVQKAMGFLITPLSRLLGYRSYYKQYDPSVTEK